MSEVGRKGFTGILVCYTACVPHDKRCRATIRFVIIPLVRTPQSFKGRAAMPLNVPKAARPRTQCAGCKGWFSNHDNHLRQSGCVGGGLAQECDEQPAEATPDEDFLCGVDDAAVGDMAFALASLKYDRGMRRPDIEAAKGLSDAAGKRTREMAFGHLQQLLRPGVDQADVIAGAAFSLSAQSGGADCTARAASLLVVEPARPPAALDPDLPSVRLHSIGGCAWQGVRWRTNREAGEGVLAAQLADARGARDVSRRKR